jgi:hypothetical protein
MSDREVRSPLERLAIPHQFQPRLSLFGALVGVAGALTRIFLGSLIGALWGVGIWMAGASSHPLFWKIPVIALLAAGLAASLAALMWVVDAAVSRLLRE